MRLYVGNLSNRVTAADLKAAFLDHGAVQQVSVVFDRESGRSRGFGFVDLTSDATIDSLQNIELDGKKLAVELSTENTSEEPNA